MISNQPEDIKTIVKTCPKHGKLHIEQCRVGIEKRWGIQPNYFYKCKQCIAGYNKKYVREGDTKKIEYVKNLRKAQTIKHKDKLLESRRKNTERNREKINLREKERRLKKHDHMKQLYRKQQQKWRDTLDDNYIKSQLTRKHKLKHKDVPQWMIEIKRSIIMLRRVIREKNDN